MTKALILLIVGYFVGMFSTLLQVLYLEKKEDRMLKDILDDKR